MVSMLHRSFQTRLITTVKGNMDSVTTSTFTGLQIISSAVTQHPSPIIIRITIGPANN